MVISQTAEYALRALAVLASLEPGQTIAAPDLARTTSIPLPYLSKVMRKLVVARLVSGRRGWGGGFALAKAPARIPFSDVLAATESDVDHDRCAFGWGRCNAKSPCPLHPVWSDLQNRFTTWADETTLADVVRDPKLVEAATRPPAVAAPPRGKTPRRRRAARR